MRARGRVLTGFSHSQSPAHRPGRSASRKRKKQNAYAPHRAISRARARSSARSRGPSAAISHEPNRRHAPYQSASCWVWSPAGAGRDAFFTSVSIHLRDPQNERHRIPPDNGTHLARLPLRRPLLLPGWSCLGCRRIPDRAENAPPASLVPARPVAPDEARPLPDRRERMRGPPASRWREQPLQTTRTVAVTGGESSRCMRKVRD